MSSVFSLPFPRRSPFGTIVLFAALIVSSSVGAQGPASVADLAERLSGAVVNISTTQKVNSSAQNERQTPFPDFPENSPFRDFFKEFFDRQPDQKRQRRPRRPNSLGSGFVVDPKGVVITNNHVIADAEEITVNFADGSKLEAEVVGRDSKTDIAVLKVSPEKPLQSVEFGDSKKLRVGDWVMAIGNPFNLGGSVTLGIVSARNRDINSGPYDDFIQTDAAINRGNSGGPLFDMDGKVVGINTAIISPSGGSIGIGFSIPSSTAIEVISQLREFGETRRGLLGVRIQEVTDEIAESLGLDNPTGALVNEVTEGSPAARAEIESGDVILEFDGREVPRMRELPRMVAGTSVGKEVEVVVWRKGKRVTLEVTVGRLEEVPLKTALAKPDEDRESERKVETALGLELAPLTDVLREKFGIEKDVRGGVVVSEVDPDSTAAEKRIEPGNIILEVGQERVASPGDVVRRLEKLKKEGRKTVLLLVSNRQGDTRFLAIRFDKEAG